MLQNTPWEEITDSVLGVLPHGLTWICWERLVKESQVCPSPWRYPGAIWFEGGTFNFSLAQQKSLLSPVPESCADGQGWNSLPSGCLVRQMLVLWQKAHTDQFRHCWIHSAVLGAELEALQDVTKVNLKKHTRVPCGSHSSSEALCALFLCSPVAVGCSAHELQVETDAQRKILVFLWSLGWELLPWSVWGASSEGRWEISCWF